MKEIRLILLQIYYTIPGDTYVSLLGTFHFSWEVNSSFIIANYDQRLEIYMLVFNLKIYYIYILHI